MHAKARTFLKFVVYNLLCSAWASFPARAIVVRLPEMQVLEERIAALGGDDFVTRTQLPKTLANQEKEASEVVFAVYGAIDHYMKGLEKAEMVEMTALQLHMAAPLIIRDILEDYPEACQELEQKGLLAKMPLSETEDPTAEP